MHNVICFVLWRVHLIFDAFTRRLVSNWHLRLYASPVPRPYVPELHARGPSPVRKSCQSAEAPLAVAIRTGADTSSASVCVSVCVDGGNYYSSTTCSTVFSRVRVASS